MTDGKVTDNGGDVHTPGPWFADVGDRSHRFVHVRDEDDRTIYYKYGSGTAAEADRDEDNAHLIAAAPDLLDALRGAIGALEFSQDFHRDLGNEEQAFAADKLDAALKAIAKATGQ